MRDFLPYLIILFILAALLRADFVLTIFYIFGGIYLGVQWWTNRALAAVRIERTYRDRAFFGERVPITLHVKNTSRLPLLWLSVYDPLPINLAVPNFFRHVVSLGSHGRHTFHYELDCRKRGFYEIGPLLIDTGDMLGITQRERREAAPQHLTVYPKIVPLTRLGLPSNSPFGSLRHHQPIFEDPSRPRGKRDYRPGDSPRRIDWKATATTSRLQTKLFEPSISLETFLFLDLDRDAYEPRRSVDGSERAIVVAASIANWVVVQRQAVGLATNAASFPSLPPRKGRPHLIRVLDVLARAELSEGAPLVEMMRRETVRLPWGTTLVVVTPRATDPVFDASLRARRAGFQVVLVLVEGDADFEAVRRRAGHFGIAAYRVGSERDMDIWRK